MMNPSKRAFYTCEIIDGASKPQFKVTCSEDNENPIIRDSPTGCWIVICNRVNELQAVKRQQVTISGPDRYGLSDPKVVKLIEDLENANKCCKYIFK